MKITSTPQVNVIPPTIKTQFLIVDTERIASEQMFS